VAPEQRHDERSAAGAVRLGVCRGASRDQSLRQLRHSWRTPPGGGASSRDRSLRSRPHQPPATPRCRSGRRRSCTEECAPVLPTPPCWFRDSRACCRWCPVRGQVPDGHARAPRRQPGRAPRRVRAPGVDSRGELVPVSKSVLSRVHQAGVLVVEGRPANVFICGVGKSRVPLADLRECGRHSRPVRMQQPANAVSDPLDVRDEQARIMRINRRQRVRVQLWPAWKPLLACERELCVVQRDQLAQSSFVDAGPPKVMTAQSLDGVRVASSYTAEQLAGALLLLLGDSRANLLRRA
jgi:hypothetical protein